jgi:pimeloyl-CoA synthetase
MELIKEEKIEIINVHLKSVVENIFNINMLIIQESAVSPINQESLDALEKQLENLFLKQEALKNELEKVNNESGQ